MEPITQPTNSEEVVAEISEQDDNLIKRFNLEPNDLQYKRFAYDDAEA